MGKNWKERRESKLWSGCKINTLKKEEEEDREEGSENLDLLE